MKRRMSLILICILAGCLFLPAFALAMGWMASPAETLYKKSGLKNQVHHLPAIVQQGFDYAVANNNMLQRLPENTRDKIHGQISRLFTARDMGRIVLNEIEAGLTEDDIAEVLEWLESPIGRKITKMEEAAGRPEAIEKMQSYINELEKSPPLEERLMLLKKLDEVVGATDTSVTVNINTQFAVATAMISAFKPGSEPRLSAIRKQLETQRPAIRTAMRPQILSSFLYTYMDLTDEEIQAYIDFATTKTGQKYHAVIIDGVEKALVACSTEWGRSIGDILAQ